MLFISNNNLFDKLFPIIYCKDEAHVKYIIKSTRRTSILFIIIFFKYLNIFMDITFTF